MKSETPKTPQSIIWGNSADKQIHDHHYQSTLMDPFNKTCHLHFFKYLFHIVMPGQKVTTRSLVPTALFVIEALMPE